MIRALPSVQAAGCAAELMRQDAKVAHGWKALKEVSSLRPLNLPPQANMLTNQA